MQIVVVGAGALGSAIVVGLAQAGAAVTLVCRGARREWLGGHPLELERDGAVHAVTVPVRDWRELAGPVEAAILCTKMGDLGDAARRLAPHLTPGAPVVALQNGVEAPAILAEHLPEAALIAGRVHGFFEMDGHRARHVGVPPSAAIGGVNPAGQRAEAAVSDLLQRAGFAAPISTDIRRDLWEKLMLSAGAAGVALLLAAPIGQVCRVPGGEALLREALGEVVAVARACGVALSPDDIERTTAFVRRFPPEATTSLQRDLAEGRPSEYDALVGAVLRLAASHGIATPIFRRIDDSARPKART